ncbi:MAG TPA: PVC-type heme-binding CxxCH protein [Gemmataceae bacterium]|nr:PVC-type heme-binding CxxCH protein [Gemmataceae bacterium]
MRHLAIFVVLSSALGIPLLFADQPGPATTQVQLNGHTFTLPVGFEIEVVAAPPLVDRPIVADFDEQGRLYVADSSGSNDKVQQQLANKPHRILRLEDTKGNGAFDRRTVFADKMMFPEGVMWYAGSVYVAAPPSIWKLTDTTGDGVADQRSEWFQGKTLTGCANDLHGPYLGPDGWIYWCKGAFAKQTYDRPGRPPLVTRAAHIFRCRPDGSGIEPVMTGGMDNPVEVVFTPGGERIFTTTFLQRPGGGRRDGLIHAVYGGVYGKVNDVLDDHPWTGPSLMPVLTHLGPAAPAGLVRYESYVFGYEYQGNLFAALFNMHKVTRHVLQPVGATFQARDVDFLVSSNLDFHPTDVLEDADGSLLVIDTGGWYKLCCPTSQLHKPDVLGAIYRIRRKGAPKIADPRGRKLAWSEMNSGELARLLDDARPAVRRRAIQALATRGAQVIPDVVEILRTGKSIDARCSAVWTLTRIDQPDARSAVRQALSHPDEIVRQAAIHSVSVWRDRDAFSELLRLVQGASRQNQRAAAEALGRLGNKAAVPVLLECLVGPGDRVLEHSLTYALIEIADREATVAGLKSNILRTRRAALMALDQMSGGKLDPSAVTPELAALDPAMRETASWIVGRHLEWGQELAGFLRDRLGTTALSAHDREELMKQLAHFARSPAIQLLVAEHLRDKKSSPEARRMLLHVISQSGLKEIPSSWQNELVRLLSQEQGELLAEAVLTARALPAAKKPSQELTAVLVRIASKSSTPAAVSLGALAAVPGGPGELSAPLFALARTNLDREQPVAMRGLAADVLSRARLTSDQLLALTDSLRTIGPMEMDRVLDAFAQSMDERVGQALLAALQASPGRSALRVETLKPRLAKFSSAIQRQADGLYAVLDADSFKQKVRLEQLLAGMQHGDIRRGQLIFNSAKAACASCHQVGYMGGNVGPDLTRIGSIRSERDLLESIIFPSASFVRSYEPVVIGTKDGKFFNGLVRKDAPEEIVLVLGANQEVHIPRDNIEDMQPSKVSVMPAGLDQQMTPGELADLVAFLKACK